MTPENISFFKISKLYLFPIGLLLAGVSFSMVIYSTKFIQKDVLSSGETINLGYLLSFFAGSLTVTHQLISLFCFNGLFAVLPTNGYR